ncbi:epithelial membrane protein 1-like [Hydra vulgaris]|uniref:Epithelial membrane protein 1-like n=1 Tax=Hydra vulgaris TaxID=6087 RepID=A0ABM4DFL2_HYDVU
MELKNIILCVLNCVGIGFAIYSTAGNYWLSDSSRFINSGIWVSCAYESCSYMTDDAWDTINVTRIFMIIGCVSYFVAFILCCLIYAKKIKNHKISGALLCATAIFLGIGLSVYSNTAYEKFINSAFYGLSYVFGWCSFAISIISAIICFAMKVETENMKI